MLCPSGFHFETKISYHINDICKVSQVFKYILFADDSNLLCCDRDLNELVRVINGGLTTADMFFC